MKIGINNIYAGIPDSLPEEWFQTLEEKGSLRIERIVSRGQATPEGQWFDQEKDEWVILLKGRAGLRFEEEADLRILQPGDHLLIPAHARHRVEWTAAGENTVWLAVHYL